MANSLDFCKIKVSLDYDNGCLLCLLFNQQVQQMSPVDYIRRILWKCFHARNSSVPEQLFDVCLLRAWELLRTWEPCPPYAGRTKRADGSPMLIPSLSRFLQHHIHKLGKRRPAENPVVIIVCSRLDLVKVGSKEAVQGVPAIDS